MVVLLGSFFIGFWVLFFIFATCEIGERMYQNSHDVEAKIIQLDWYKYPYEVQRMMPIFIMNAQKGIIKFNPSKLVPFIVLII